MAIAVYVLVVPMFIVLMLELPTTRLVVDGVTVVMEGIISGYAARLRRFQMVIQRRVRSNATYGSFVCMPIRVDTPRSIG
jgi:hypothetical protein